MSDEVDVAGHHYRVERLPPMVQFHVVRRMGAALASCLATYLDEKASAQQMMIPVMEAIGRLTDEDAEYVINTCMGAVRRHESRADTWAPVMVGGRPMFDDVTMPVMLAIVREVLQVQLSGFFSAVAPPASNGAAQATGQASPTARTS